jgi:hypothetical protein
MIAYWALLGKLHVYVRNPVFATNVEPAGPPAIVNSTIVGSVTAPVDPFTLAATGANVESPRRKFVAVAPLPSLAVDITPLVMSLAAWL